MKAKGARYIVPLAALAALGVSLILTNPFGNLMSIVSGKSYDQPIIPVATAASFPFEVDIHTEPKLRVGDANVGGSYLQINSHYMDPEQHCEECTFIKYVPGPEGKAGFAYKMDKVLDFKGAKKVKFFAMGQDGGEKIKFKVAGKSAELNSVLNNAVGSVNIDGTVINGTIPKKLDPLQSGIFRNLKFSAGTQEIPLQNDWKMYEIPLNGVNLDNVDYPFGLEVAKGNGAKEIKFFIKGIVFDTEDANTPVALETQTQ